MQVSVQIVDVLAQSQVVEAVDRRREEWFQIFIGVGGIDAPAMGIEMGRPRLAEVRGPC